MSAVSSKSLFRATKPKPKRDARQSSMSVGKKSERPANNTRRALDFYPTAQPEAIRALLARDGERIGGLGSVWEPAAGHGDLSREIEAFGLPCINSDVVDHGADNVQVRSFYDFTESLAPTIITNPPYCEINARDGHGRWLRHTLSLTGWRYCALLLSWDWPAARANGLGELLNDSPFSYCYLMRWKLDFSGEGSPPQRNAWFVWDRDWPHAEPAFRWMDKTDWRQGSLLLTASEDA